MSIQTDGMKGSDSVQGLKFQQGERKIKVFILDEHHLDNIGSTSKECNLFSGIVSALIGATITLWITYQTIDPTAAPQKNTWLLISQIFTVFSIIFAGLWWMYYKKQKDLIDKIKEDTIH